LTHLDQTLLLFAVPQIDSQPPFRPPRFPVLMAKLRNPNAGKAMRRRDVIALLGGAAAWPVAARAQQRLRRIGVLASALAADDPEWQTRGTAFVQALQQLGWTDGRNVRLDYRFGLGDPDRRRKAATDLVALAPDVLLAGGTAAVATLQQATRTVPIVFANVVDPIGHWRPRRADESPRDRTVSHDFPDLRIEISHVAPRVEGSAR